jgi:hypothetical protein
MERALALGVPHFRKNVKVKDDSLEAVVEFDTSKGFVKRPALFSGELNEEALRGFLDKKTGKKSYQVYVVMLYQGDHWIYPVGANFGTPLQTVKTTRIHKQKSCADRRYTGVCRFREEVAFPVPEAELRRVQKASAAQGGEPVWPFRLKTKDGKDYTGGVPAAEVVALLETMDAYKPVPMR